MKVKKNNEKKNLLITLGVISILIAIGLTYAFWHLSKEQTSLNIVNTDCFNVDFMGENDITLNNAYPLDDEKLRDETPYHFTITNECSSQASATINLESLNTDTDKQLDDELIDVILYENDYHDKLNKNTKLTSNLNNDDNKVIEEALHAYSLKSFTLESNETKDYYLLLYIDQETPLQEDAQNATWNGKITLSAEYIFDQFANSGTLRTISSNDTNGMWNYKDKLTKIIIETEKNPKKANEGQIVYGPFDESNTNDRAVESYVVCDIGDTNCIGYLQGDGGIKLNKNSDNLFYNFNNVTKIKGIENLDTSSVENMIQMFQEMSNLQQLDLSKFDTSNVTDMSRMFSGMSNLQTLILGNNFDTSMVTDMISMFSGLSSLQTLILGDKFDTSKVTSMGSMFSEMSQLKNLNLSTFDTSQVTDMSSMFSGMSNLQNLILGDNFNTKSVTNMNYMFNEMSNLQYLDLSNFDTSSVTDMIYMFSGMSQLQNLIFGNSFNTSKVTNMYGMFSGMKQLQSLDLSKFDTRNVTDMSSMFINSINLNNITYGLNFIHKSGASTNLMFGNCPANKPNINVHSSWQGISFN